MVVYKITNKMNGKVYIGQTVRSLEKRWKEHKNSANKTPKYSKMYIHRTINKYGFENFKIEVISRANDIEELNYRENYCIRLFNCLAPDGYNLKTGGNNSRYCEKSKKKISESHKGKKVYNSQKVICLNNNMIFESQAAAGKFIGSRSVYDCISGRKEHIKGYVFKKLSDWDGKIWTEKDLKLFFKKYKQKTFSKMSKIRKGKSLEHFKVRVKCVNNGKTYNSVTEASEELGLHQPSVSRAAQGTRKQIKGYIFEYVNK